MEDQDHKPVCGAELGANWIDGGTMCRSRSKTPGPVARTLAKATPVASAVANPPPATTPTRVQVMAVKDATRDIAVFAEVIADGSKVDIESGETTFNNGVEWKTPAYEYDIRGGKKVITKLNGVFELKGTITIQTFYRPGAKPADRSAYGRGTTTKDERTGNVSLGFHESCHRADYLRFLQTTPLPTFRGKVGMAVEAYDKAVADFGREMEQYSKKMDAYSEARTDEVGYKRSRYSKKGPRP